MSEARARYPAIPPGEELLVCTTIAPEEDAYCDCGRRVLSAEDGGGFAGALRLELACPRCPARVLVTVRAEDGG